MKDKKKILMGLGVLSIVFLTLGLTYAFFNYSRNGTTENSITVGAITFIYEEIDQQGSGISITDALPTSDNDGKSGQAFNFKIKSSNAMDTVIPYQITARKSTTIENPLPDDAIRIYLTKVNSSTNNETEVLLDNYSNLITLQYNNHNDEILWNDQVPANDTNYEQNYKLRMWLDSDVDFSNGNYNNKEFSIKVNVYGGTAKQNEPDAPEISTLTSTVGTVSEVLDPSLGYDYITSELPTGTTNLTLNITTEDANDQVTAERIDGIALANDISNIQRLSTVHSVPLTLTNGDNYFKIKIKAVSKKKTEKIIKVVVTKSNVAALSSLSIDDCDIGTFSTNTTSYTCTTSRGSLTVHAVASNNGTYQVSGNTGLQTGTNTVTITATAENGINTQPYTVTVTKLENLVFDTNTQVNDVIELGKSGTYKKIEFRKSGTYKVELWGAQGGNYVNNNTVYPGGYGGYVSGNISINNDIDLYAYVGGQSSTITGGYNGGGAGRTQSSSSTGYGGGGATDLRYFSSTPTSEDLAWNSSIGLNSRIIVAAGGGSTSFYNGPTNIGLDGDAGGLTGYKGDTNTTNAQFLASDFAGYGGTQVSAGVGGTTSGTNYCTPGGSGYFGKGGNGGHSCGGGGAGGGAGYYGGGGTGRTAKSAGGGSSFISGHQGCLAIAEGSTSEPRALKTGCTSSSTSTECATHYSGLYFTSTNMIDGKGHTWTTQDNGTDSNNLMPNPESGYYTEGLGRAGDGYLRITYLGN